MKPRQIALYAFLAAFITDIALAFHAHQNYLGWLLVWILVGLALDEVIAKVFSKKHLTISQRIIKIREKNPLLVWLVVGMALFSVGALGLHFLL